ncbi:MAG: FkbM family methyltransferase [bacterium]|nr:FkbM family methyltransferase [bacterium]
MKLLIRLSDIPLGKKVALYGAGQAGTAFLKIIETFRSDLTVVCLIDSFKTGEARGLPIWKPGDFKKQYGHIKADDPLVLVTSIKWREIETVIRDHHIDHYLIVPPRFLFPSGYRKLSTQPLEPCDNSLSPDIFKTEDREEFSRPLQETLNLLRQNGDRLLFRMLTGEAVDGQSRVRWISEYYYAGAFNRQYLDFVDFPHIRTMIEGGVANGEDTRVFLKHMAKPCKVYGFEPNAGEYGDSPHRRFLKTEPHVRIFPFGLWSKTGKGYLNQRGTGSQLQMEAPPADDSRHFLTIDTMAVDDFVVQEKIEKVDFIKMDIEGAEVEALKGAVDTLKHHRPQMAVCLYHKKEHFFQVPLFLARHLDNYTYRIGHYTAGTLETVWYAIPNEVYKHTAT